MTFGELTRSARIAAGFTQRELAERSGISLRTIQNYESGKRLPKQKENFAFLANALGIDEKHLRQCSDVVKPPKRRRGSSLPRNAKKLLKQIIGLYESGKLTGENMDTIIKALAEARCKSKKSRSGLASDQ